jgi:hypothetical protein
MTHITERRVIGNHADMGASTPAVPPASLTMTEIVRAGILRTASRREMFAAQSIWDSEGGVIKPGKTGGEGRSAPDGR